jgi:hypothetical protein
MKFQRTLIVTTTLGALIYSLLPALSNTWYLLIDTQDIYVIPEGSSLFTFRPTEMNSGSGDWWIYGEDSHHYYYFENNINISKQTAVTCPNFVKTDLATWCKKK